MIKLKDIIKEIVDTERMEYGRSWLSPDGKFISTNDDNGKMVSHPNKALDIALEIPVEPNPDITASDFLYKRGWQRIITGKLGGEYVLFCSNPFTQPNSKQKSELIKLAQEFDINQVIYDNEKLRGDKYHLIWSKDDVLEEGFDYEIKNKKGQSWLKPDGIFIPVQYSHGSDAYNIRYRSFQNKNNFKAKDDHIMELWKLGWQRIYNLGLITIYSHNEKMPPNRVQLKSLIDFAIEAGVEKIIWDGGDKEKILWSIHDTLEENLNDEEPNEGDERAYSWLKPNGEFLPVQFSHQSDAYTVRFGDFQSKKDFNPADDHAKELFKSGWQRITHSKFNKEIYTNNKFRPPSPIQLKALKDFAIEIKAKRIVWDNDGYYRPLWSSDEVLEEKA